LVAPRASVAIALVLLELSTVELLLSNEVSERHDSIPRITNDDAVRVCQEERCMVAQSARGRR